MTEDVSEFTKPQANSYVFYDKDVNLEEQETVKTCAYMLTIDNKESYYIKFLRGSLFDPQGMDFKKINALNTNYKKVSKETFGFYAEYLKTKKRNQLTWAERSSIDV